MNQDLKNYCRRTLAARIGGWGSQILLLCLGQTTFLSLLFVIAIMEILYLTVYLLIFGIRREDGTWKRFKKMDKIIKACGCD